MSTIDQLAGEVAGIITQMSSRAYLVDLRKIGGWQHKQLTRGDLMTIWKRWIQRGVLCGLLLGGLVAFATTASAADSMPAITDHAGMTAWYEKEAATNRQKAKSMEDMKVEYGKSPAFAQGMAGLGGKTNIPQHCDALISAYTKAAEESDQFAKGHRSMVK